jgi:hypothetical protein
MRKCALWAVLLAWVGAAPASAGQILIDFDFGGSSLSVLGGLISIPPDGSITSASGVVQVKGNGLTTISAGFAKLENLTFAATVNANTLSVLVTGNAAANQPGTAPGQLTAGLTNILLPNPFLLNMTGTIQCSGANCGLLGTFPINLTGPQAVTIGTLPIGNVGSLGLATINGSFSLTVGGFTAVLNLVGTEIDRTFVPEPNSFGLVAMGLAGLAALRRQAQRRR